MLTTLGSISFVVFATFDVYKTDIPAIEVFRSVAIVLAGILGIVGIVQEKLWAKWFVIIVYGLYIFAAIEGIVNSFSTAAVLKLFISSNTLIGLRVGRLITIVMLLVGVVLLLKKPRLEANVGERE
ncbi:hypothetical protein VB741_19760 [Leptothoe sp. PORK10 BA2]|nr:hypothetical protein [Leptothoe sp. PORK10 BA2]